MLPSWNTTMPEGQAEEEGCPRSSASSPSRRTRRDRLRSERCQSLARCAGRSRGERREVIVLISSSDLITRDTPSASNRTSSRGTFGATWIEFSRADSRDADSTRIVRAGGGRDVEPMSHVENRRVITHGSRGAFRTRRALHARIDANTTAARYREVIGGYLRSSAPLRDAIASPCFTVITARRLATGEGGRRGDADSKSRRLKTKFAPLNRAV